jgi:uncharacterized protein (DUF1501 family)
MALTRREFLKSGLALVSVGLAMPSVFTRAVYALELDRSQSTGQAITLVIVQMAGGNDGLNTVIPYTAGAYQANRPRLAIEDKDILRLDGRIGLHPSLAPLKEL